MKLAGNLSAITVDRLVGEWMWLKQQKVILFSAFYLHSCVHLIEKIKADLNPEHSRIYWCRDVEFISFFPSKNDLFY